MGAPTIEFDFSGLSVGLGGVCEGKAGCGQIRFVVMKRLPSRRAALRPMTRGRIRSGRGDDEWEAKLSKADGSEGGHRGIELIGHFQRAGVTSVGGGARDLERPLP